MTDTTKNKLNSNDLPTQLCLMVKADGGIELVDSRSEVLSKHAQTLLTTMAEDLLMDDHDQYVFEGMISDLVLADHYHPNSGANVDACTAALDLYISIGAHVSMAQVKRGKRRGAAFSEFISMPPRQLVTEEHFNKLLQAQAHDGARQASSDD